MTTEWTSSSAARKHTTWTSLLIGAFCCGAAMSACDLNDSDGSSEEEGESMGEEEDTFDPIDSGETSATGGGTDTDAGATGGTCEFAGSGSGPECDACIADSCCDAVMTCSTEPDCACVMDCFAETPDEPNPAACFEQCGVSEFPPAFFDIFTCRNEVCAATCDTGNDSSTDGPMTSGGMPGGSTGTGG